ncbi:aspartate beta-hydroxylase domain-containing protein 2-like [Ptychodera flava]|uniref:aspartate beta-hydroxylase domain-containing protein 2-like n=1 Tax=Ptychodera flava TaxID=63121 RepID=UPI00396A690B
MSSEASSWYASLYEVIISLIFVILIFVFKRYRWLLPADDRDTNTQNAVDFAGCDSPDCVRCRKYKRIQGQLLPKLEDIATKGSWDGLERILSAIEEVDIHSANQETTLQQPNVFFLPGLRSVPWCEDVHRRELRKIKDSHQRILQDFKNIYRDFRSGNPDGWLTNNVPTGEWHVFHLINQGVTIEQNCRRCPKTVQLLTELDNLMTNNVFGNATFSVLQPGTHITEHYGPTNARLRAHIGLIVPPKCHLTVGGETRNWAEGECLIFDDSFLHEAKHDGRCKDGPRVIFMVDFWHPDVTDLERKVLDDLFASTE